MARTLSRDDDRAGGQDDGGPVDEASRAAERASATRTEHAIARIGLGSRSVVYLALAVIMIELAAGRRTGETDQGGALQTLGRTVAGDVLLVVLAVGVLCYTSWRWLEAARRHPEEGRDRASRIKAVIEGACYLPFLVMSIAVLAGNNSRAAQDKHYRAWSARVMQWPAGQVLVGIVGGIVVGVGVYLASEGPRRSFRDQLDQSGVARAWQRATTVLGVVGSLTRGIVFALAGVLVIVAAATTDPAKAGGVDVALKTVARQPFGRALLIAAAVGMAAFGLFTLAEAKWRKT